MHLSYQRLSEIFWEEESQNKYVKLELTESSKREGILLL